MCVEFFQYKMKDLIGRAIHHEKSEQIIVEMGYERHHKFEHTFPQQWRTFRKYFDARHEKSHLNSAHHLLKEGGY